MFYALRLPVEGAAEGPATEEHGALLLHAVGLGRHAGAYSKRFFTGLPAFHFCAVNFPLQPEWLNIETESLMPPRLHEVAGRALLACAHRAPSDPAEGRDAGSRPCPDDHLARTNSCVSPEAVGPASRLRRRYADAPAAAFLTGHSVPGPAPPVSPGASAPLTLLPFGEGCTSGEITRHHAYNVLTVQS
jgi:hypothetical protein